MTPVIKGYGTDKGYDIANNMQQVYGGHGYVREWGMEQFVRDSRIAMIYEGTNGVQAMDLCGRKLAAGGGKAIQAFFAMIDEEIATARQDESLKSIAERLEKALGEAENVKLAWKPNLTVEMDEKNAGTLIKLIDTLEDDDDVQTVWGNYEISDDIMEKVGA